jgi:phosphoglycerate dehydrogenase-like enzyme
MARILITARFDAEAVARLRQHHKVVYESWLDTGVFPTGDELVAKLNRGRHEIYVNEGDQVPTLVIQRLRATRLICVARASPSNVDIAAATEAGIVVTNAPGRNAVAVAEYTIGLMIALIRGICFSNHMVLDGTWEFWRFRCLEGIELTGHTIGLVGVGHVGREVATRLRGFNMRILGYDPYVDPQLANSAGVGLVTLQQLLHESDIVSIHAAATKDSHGLIGAREIALMKPTAYFINTARAVVTDEQALYEALRDKRIAGAALDVFLDEPLHCDNPLTKLDNVLVTPHLAGATREVIVNHSRMIEEDIQAYVSGHCPPRAVNPQAWRSG